MFLVLNAKLTKLFAGLFNNRALVDCNKQDLYRYLFMVNSQQLNRVDKVDFF